MRSAGPAEAIRIESASESARQRDRLGDALVLSGMGSQLGGIDRSEFAKCALGGGNRIIPALA